MSKTVQFVLKFNISPKASAREKEPIIIKLMPQLFALKYPNCLLN